MHHVSWHTSMWTYLRTATHAHLISCGNDTSSRFLRSPTVSHRCRGTQMRSAPEDPVKSWYKRCLPDKQTLFLGQKHSHSAPGVQMSAWDSQPGPAGHGSFLRPHSVKTRSLEGREKQRWLPNRWSSRSAIRTLKRALVFLILVLHEEITLITIIEMSCLLSCRAGLVCFGAGPVRCRPLAVISSIPV